MMISIEPKPLLLLLLLPLMVWNFSTTMTVAWPSSKNVMQIDTNNKSKYRHTAKRSVDVVIFSPMQNQHITHQ